MKTTKRLSAAYDQRMGKLDAILRLRDEARARIAAAKFPKFGVAA